MESLSHFPFLLGAISTTQVVIILIIILIIFGGRKLPELAKGLGQAMREFKKATREAEDTIRTAMDDEPDKPSKPAQPEVKKPSADDEPKV